jgi:MFS family permease
MGPSSGPPGASPSTNDKILFWASFFTLIAAGIGFSVRGVILKDWGQQFGFTQSELGTITGGGLVGFGLAIIFFSFFSDMFGYGKTMAIAFLLHASSAIVTFAATPVYASMGKEGAFMCLNIGMWLFAFGNGTCEAVINPLTATLFKNNKTHWLNILHAGWPGGLILGAVITLGINQMETPIRWEYKLGVFLVPVLLYGIMMFGRRFPDSEAKTAGISMQEMMGTVGMAGMAVAIGLLGLLLSSQVMPSLASMLKIDLPSWSGWVVALAVWVIYGLVTKFAFGSLLIAFLYLMHALVGYVELGTDSWITNITERVLSNQNLALGAFIWTNALMFTLRFFAGPIVEKINPIGLLFASAAMGVIGLYLLGHPSVNSIWPWMAAVTIYGVGKTFYWPTLLGVISERFPKGGALALGISGGVGMMSAGLLGGPGIGYKQDYFAIEAIQTTSKDAYERYVSRNDKGEPEAKPFPLLTQLFPDKVPLIAGLDNGKLKVFDDYAGHLAKIDEANKAGKEPPKGPATTLEADLDVIKKLKAEGKTVEPKLEENLTGLNRWWETKGKPNYAEDKDKIQDARLHGAKTALLYTAIVPAVLAVGFMLLILYFFMLGGYKQVHLDQRPVV